MADDLSKRGPSDWSRINTTEEWELAYWTKELGVSAEELKNLVAWHGNSAAAVRRALGKSAA
jgi:hypothetical protein